MTSSIHRDVNKTAVQCGVDKNYHGYFSGFKIKEKSFSAFDFLSDFKNAVDDQNAGFVALEEDGHYFYVGVGYAQTFEDEFKEQFTPEI